MQLITEELFVAYTECPYKAYCLLNLKDKAIPNEHATILIESEKTYAIKRYINQLKKNKLDVQRYSKEKLLRCEADRLINAVLRLDDFRTFCPVLIKNESANSYEPIVFTGQHTISKQDQIMLSYIGYILTGIQGGKPENGKVITRNNKAHNIKLTECTQKAKLIIEPLEELINQSDTDPPTLILNKNCSYCEFESFCRAVAKEQDSLSLLHGISTKKSIDKYQKKGIFTVKQLSYLYKPRKQKKRAKTTALLHKFELQALAIRTNKIYLLETPDITRQSVEIFFDIEGSQDRQSYYLLGLVIYIEDRNLPHSLWTNTSQDGGAIFKKFITIIHSHPISP